jgi:hypothetical protein
LKSQLGKNGEEKQGLYLHHSLSPESYDVQVVLAGFLAYSLLF